VNGGAWENTGKVANVSVLSVFNIIAEEAQRSLRRDYF
jgi:hypothetical protein